MQGSGIADVDIAYNTQEEMFMDSDCVIYGEVSDYEYHSGDGAIYTIYKVKVLDSIYGELKCDDEISLFQQGGYSIIRDYTESFGSEEEKEAMRESQLFSGLSDNEMETEYISQFCNGTVDLDIGDRAILFLQKRQGEENMYETTGFNEGEFIEVGDDQYILTSTNWPGGIRVCQIVENMDKNDDPIYSYDNCKSYNEIVDITKQK